MAILTLFLRQILFSAASMICLPYLSWGLPLCFCPMVIYVSICVHVYLWLSHFPSLWIGIQGFCCHCAFLLTNVAVCGRPWVIGLYILSLKEVIWTFCANVRRSQCGLVWLGFGGCCYCFSFSLEEVPQAETLRDPRRAIKISFCKRSYM